MERQLMMTGIGGQGVQLATQVLARACVVEGREVLMFGNYGGMMRGGNTETTLVVGDGPVESPPILPETWSAILMHHDYWAPVRDRLRPGSLVLVNTSVFDHGELDANQRAASEWQLVEVAATDLAVDVGNIVCASLVMVGAYAATTQIVSLDALAVGVEQSLPSYRHQLVSLNVAALQAGHDAVPAATAVAGLAAPAPVPSS